MIDDLDLGAWLLTIDAQADELLAALDAPCKGIDEIVYNACTNPLVFENDSEEDHT